MRRSRQPSRGLFWAGRVALSPPAIGALAGALYLLTIAPSITVAHGSADSGELVAVAGALGVAHPPGYGLYLLLARGALEAFAFLDEPALRTNVLSALLTAGGVAALVAVARRLTTPLAAAAGALVAATAPVVWSQAIVTEVYALAFLLAALALLAALRLWERPASGVRWAMLGLVLGTAAAHHPTGWLLAAALGGAALTLRPAASRPGIALAAAALPLGVAWLYLVLRADAPLAWGDTGSLEGWWRHVRGAAYAGLWEWSPAEVASAVPASVRLLVRQFPPPAWPLLPLGALLLWERRPWLTAALLLHALALVLLVTVYRAEGREPYLAAAVASGALLTALGLDRAIEAGRALAQRQPALATLLSATAGAFGAIAIAWAAATGFDVELRGERDAEARALRVLEQAAPDAVLHTDEDELTFPLWYLRLVRGMRPDVTIVDVRGLAPVVGDARAPVPGEAVSRRRAGPGRARGR